MKKLIYLSMLGAALLAACGPQATPTMNPADVQGTAFAAASTMVAQTQAAIPTSTPIPPTETPSPTPAPTDTPPIPPTSSLPTLAPTLASGGTGGDPCNSPLPADPAGRPTTIKIENQTNGSLTLSLYLNKTPFATCGYRGYNIAKGGSVLITDLVQGCYNVSVYVNDPKAPSKSFGYGCINDEDKWTFLVGPEVVRLIQ